MALSFLACCNGDGFNRNTDGERTNFLYSGLNIWMLKCVRNIKMDFNRLLEINA